MCRVIFENNGNRGANGAFFSTSPSSPTSLQQFLLYTQALESTVNGGDVHRPTSQSQVTAESTTRLFGHNNNRTTTTGHFFECDHRGRDVSSKIEDDNDSVIDVENGDDSHMVIEKASYEDSIFTNGGLSEKQRSLVREENQTYCSSGMRSASTSCFESVSSSSPSTPKMGKDGRMCEIGRVSGNVQTYDDQSVYTECFTEKFPECIVDDEYINQCESDTKPLDLTRTTLEEQQQTQTLISREKISTLEKSMGLGEDSGKVTSTVNEFMLQQSCTRTKRRKRVVVANECKDDRYWARRLRNNEAAKRSRNVRIQKERATHEHNRQLKMENDLLKDKLHSLTQQMNDTLAQLKQVGEQNMALKSMVKESYMSNHYKSSRCFR